MERFAEAVADRVRAGLARLEADYRRRGRSLVDLGEPARVAERMLAVVPTPSPWDDVVGPFYSTRGVARLLGGVSRQAVMERRQRGRLLGLRTAEGDWVFPAFQFGADLRPVPGLAEVLACFDPHDVDEWTLAGWLVGGRAELGGRSVIDWLAAGDPLEAVLTLARDAAARFAA